MTPTEAMAAVESRAFALRLTVGELCQAAGVHPSVWSRAKSRGTISPKLLQRVEMTCEALERSRAAEEKAA